jgi:hypothetical protein
MNFWRGFMLQTYGKRTPARQAHFTGALRRLLAITGGWAASRGITGG